MARKFLFLVAFLVVLVIAGGLVLATWWRELSAYTLVPDSEFVEQPQLAENVYANPLMWFSMPDIAEGDPARWQPEGLAHDGGEAPRYAVFFIHPTSYIPVKYVDDMEWNAGFDNDEANERARLFITAMASPFGRATEIWTPRYRQAVFGAFLADTPQADKALDLAYGDVAQAFDYFLSHADPTLPIVLAGHSQGSLHLLRLLRERVAGIPLAGRIAAAYAIGWPVSVAHDLPALGLPACEAAGDSGCVMSWLSFAEPADPSQMLGRYNWKPGFDGKDRQGSPILCINPITGTRNGAAPASANLGTLVPDIDFQSGHLEAGMVPARCDDRGLLLVGAPLELGPYALPGNNYHVYDVPMFWRNVQIDVERRVKAWQTTR